MTTGAFYGCYKSKEELLEALVGEQYAFLLRCFQEARRKFAALPHDQQPEVTGDFSKTCLLTMLHYAYEHLESCKLLLCCSEGTRFAGLVDKMVEIEVSSMHADQEVLKEPGRPHLGAHVDYGNVPHVFRTGDSRAAAGTGRELCERLRTFYTAGWMKIMEP